MSYIEKEKLIKADIASIENRVRHAFNQGYDLGFKDGKSKQANCSEIPTGSTTKDDLVADVPDNNVGNIDCISRSDAIHAVSEALKHTFVEYEDIANKVIGKLPSVIPQEPRKGHWIKTPKAVMGEGYMWYCDKCEYQVYQDTSRNYPSEKYCPNCGADMREAKK